MVITAEKDRQLCKGKLKRDDVVMTTRGTIGDIGLYSEDVPFDNIRINSGMLIFRPNKRALLS
jgi:type I restriction enzyme, S subunit